MTNYVEHFSCASSSSLHRFGKVSLEVYVHFLIELFVLSLSFESSLYIKGASSLLYWIVIWKIIPESVAYLFIPFLVFFWVKFLNCDDGDHL